MVSPQPTIQYKSLYNVNRCMREPKWGGKVTEAVVQCPWCGSLDMYYSAHPDSPEEILNDTLRCKNCGHVTDYFEALKQREHHPTDTPREVTGRPR